MQIHITDRDLCAVVALEGLKGRTVEIQTEDNKTLKGVVSGIGETGLNVDDDVHGKVGQLYTEIHRLRVTG